MVVKGDELWLSRTDESWFSRVDELREGANWFMFLPAGGAGAVEGQGGEVGQGADGIQAHSRQTGDEGKL